MRKLLAIALLFLPLSGCLRESEFSPIPALGGGGGGSAPAPMEVPHSVNQPNLPATGASKMLQDPEASEEGYSDYVWAPDEATARSLCQKTADRHGWRLDDVQGEKFVNNAGKRKFTCYWTTYGAPK